MAKFRKKLKNQSNGKRWQKGQSSSSNPETTKHRDLAARGFFQRSQGPSNLTEDALQKHEASQNFITNQQVVPMEQDHEDAATSLSFGSFSSYSTTKTFASDFSQCSNMSYQRFLAVYQPDSALHKEMLSFLSAIRDVIVADGGNETSTEYFAALVSTLEECFNAEERDETRLSALLALLKMGIRSVPESVLRRMFKDVAAKMIHILKEYIDSDNNVVITSILGVLATLMRKQELASWSHNEIQQIFSALLNPFCVHNKPKWRKAAQKAVAVVVTSEYFEGAPVNVAADKVAEFCREILDPYVNSTSGTVSVSSVQAGQTSILHVLNLIKGTIHLYNKAHIKKICEIILALLTLNYPLVTSNGMEALNCLFSAEKSHLNKELNARIISALYEYQPSSTDAQASAVWLTVMQQAHISLAKYDLATSCTALPKIFTTAAQFWLSDRPEIMTTVTHTQENLLKKAIEPACRTPELAQQHHAKLSRCFNQIEICLNYQYHNVWHQVLHVIGVMFEVAGGTCSELLKGCLKTLADLRDSYQFSFNRELEFAVGAAVRSMGPEVVLDVITLKRENGTFNIDRSWMIPVLKENIKKSTLRYFDQAILPMAQHCKNRHIELAKANEGSQSHSFELLYMQLWSLLPCFCSAPTDVAHYFNDVSIRSRSGISFARHLGEIIKDKQELRLCVMAGLRKLITSAKETNNHQAIEELAKVDMNYLLILFNVYCKKPIGSEEEGQRLAAMDTIKVYLTIAKPANTNFILVQTIKKLNSSSEDPEESFQKESFMDLIRALVPYLTMENVQHLYEQCIEPLPTIKNKKEQKKAYRLLEEICGSRSEGCLAFVKAHLKEVQKLLRASLETSAVSSKGARLKCLGYLIRAQPQLDHDSKLIRQVLPEAISSCKDLNVKTRTIAFELLNVIGDTLQEHREMPVFVVMVMSGVMVENPPAELVECTVLAMASILNNYTGSLGLENIQSMFEKVSGLMKSSSRSVISAGLSFIKIYCSVLPTPIVAGSLKTIMTCLTEMTMECRKHFRVKVHNILNKLLTKYGCESLTQYVPNTDVVLYKMLKNLRKSKARKDQRKSAKDKEDGDSDQEDEFLKNAKSNNFEDILADSDSETEPKSEDENVKARKKRMASYIEEGGDSIVDFTDPSVLRKITTKPLFAQASSGHGSEKKEPVKDRGFKMSSDGRLIIKDGDDSGDEDGDKKDKKLKINLQEDSDSDEGEHSLAETLILGDRKRKRSAESVKSGASSQPPLKYKPGGSGIHRPTSSASSVRSKGDARKKSAKHEPYAYVPLAKLNKKKGKGVTKPAINIVKSKIRKGKKANKGKGKAKA